MDLKASIPNLNTNDTSTKMYRNFPMVPRVIFGRGCFDQLGDIIMPKRRHSEAPFIFLVDDVFENQALVDRIPMLFNDQIIYISAEEEPKTNQIDTLVDEIASTFSELPSGVVGIGGGTVLDIAKAVSILLTNEGGAKDYQGWDLVKLY